MRGRVPGDGIMMDMSVSSVDSFVQQTLCQSCSRTFKSIWGVLKFQ